MLFKIPPKKDPSLTCPFTTPPQFPSLTLTILKSKLRSDENLSSRSTQKPEQHL